MHEDLADSDGKTFGDLGAEALWFAAHTLVAMMILLIVVAAMSLAHPDPEAGGPKMLGSVLALFVPFLGGFVIARIQRNRIALSVWVSGVMLFLIACVWVLDLPTGPGLCERCTASEKLYRTFFDIENGSGLMSGDGLLVGVWLPLSLLGYAIGARLALTKQRLMP